MTDRPDDQQLVPPAGTSAGPPGDMETVEVSRLRRFARELFAQAGMPDGDAAVMADHLIWADLRGLAWIGVNKIPQYLARLRAGGTVAHAVPGVVGRSSALLTADGHDGFGQGIAYRTMNVVIERAASTASAAAVVRDTPSAGALGGYASLAAEQRMSGLAITNAPPRQCAPGGADKVVGNQAHAIASPAGR